MKPSASIPLLLLTIISSSSLSVNSYRIFEYPEDQYIIPQLDVHRLLNAGNNNFTDNVMKVCSNDQKCFDFAAYLYTQSELREGNCPDPLSLIILIFLSQFDRLETSNRLKCCAEHSKNPIPCCDAQHMQHICVIFLFLGLKYRLYVILTNSAHVMPQL
ncbi:hypothetical protein BO83DRAFT_375872 [Aspergillus eucalypticola CBS 122712]|uniref:Uncharacterized protein n=1 Tax=Aspergillus eucalypticola (strain CBS 122712 / IBT 29274) TaxID=1448314 RepID=A0A317VZX1_ASPEC|nr:uncharacterized protein BO83DRAFT_375872 [Aspergillus eucalypticola CBS 122712]PWY79926.1 hypothetical protein BO83DRAFT_375872 [Aspergillus eucalypticola CBS 122712]